MTNNAANRRFWLCQWVVPIFKSVPIKLAQLDFATKSAKMLFQLNWHKCQSFSDNWHNKNPYKIRVKSAFVPMCQFTSYSTQVREIPKRGKKYISVRDKNTGACAWRVRARNSIRRFFNFVNINRIGGPRHEATHI